MQCINCKFELEENSHFCPNCGQKVDENNLAIKAVTKEFFENYIALDTRFGRSIKPFLFKPGFLALQFIHGKRVSFANPFRLYIITSIFFFFCFTTYLNQNQSTKSQPIINIGSSKLYSFEELNKAELGKLNERLSVKSIDRLNKYRDSSFTSAYNKLKLLSKKQVIGALEDSTLERLQLISDTSILKRKTSINFDTGSDHYNENLDWDFNMNRINPYLKDESYTNEMLYDSLIRGAEVSFFKEFVYRQTIKFSRASESEIRRTIFGNLSLGMFVLIPLYALFLKLIFYRRNRYYVAHLIHTVYLQSFAYLVFGLCLFLAIYIPFFDGNINSLFFITSIIFAYYFVKSIRRVYNQTRLKALIVSGILFVLYAILSLFSFVGEVLISFLLF